MAAETKKGLTPRAQDHSQWYLDVIARADLADYAPVKGCMIIKPYGFAIWEMIRDALDRMIKDTGHSNAYFPLFIPVSFLAKEAQHVEGFAMECAVVTHSGLQKAAGDGPARLVPKGELEEALVVRPTSETIIWHAVRGWISSWRDLPLLLNQWANIVRWEMRTRLFLRTLEFLWQEGHTAHATEEEAREEVARMLEVYRTLAEDWLAMAVVPGKKSESEKFAGAVDTYAIEALMQDNKALQAGTSHFLGQNFARAFDVAFQDKDGQRKLVQTTSWGVSTRLVGGLIMSHGDDRGLVLPPRIAPIQVVVVPIFKNDAEGAKVKPVVERIAAALEERGIRVRVDDRDNLSPGAKYYEWEGKGVPLRVEVGPKDVDKGTVVVARRDAGDKQFLAPDAFLDGAPALLERIQREMLERSRARTKERTFDRGDYAGLREVVDGDRGMARSPWCGAAACEAKVKEETKATIRVIPLGDEGTAGGAERCVVCGAEAKWRPLFAKAY